MVQQQMFSEAFIISITYNVSLFSFLSIFLFGFLAVCFSTFIFWFLPFFPTRKRLTALISNLRNNFLCHFVDLAQKSKKKISNYLSGLSSCNKYFQKHSSYLSNVMFPFFLPFIWFSVHLLMYFSSIDFCLFFLD